MAIALDNTSNNGTTSGSKTWPHTLTADTGTDRILLVVVSIEQSSPNISAATYNGQSMTLAVSATETPNQTAIFYLLEADLPGAGTYTIAITTNETNPDNDVACAISLSGVKQEAPEDTNSQTTTSSSGLSTSITPSDGAWVIEAYQSSNAPVTLDPASSQTEFHDNNARGSLSAAASHKHHVSAGATNEGWSCSSSSTRQIHLLVSLAIAGVAVVAAYGYPYEAAAVQENSLLANLESMQAVATAPQMPTEALNTLPATQSPLFESLQQLIALHEQAIESRGFCAITTPLDLESLSRIDSEHLTPIETLANQNKLSTLDLESTQGASIDLTALYEAKQHVTVSLDVVVESLYSAIEIVSLCWEAGGIYAIELPLVVCYETLARPVAQINTSFEGLSQKKSAHNFPFSSSFAIREYRTLSLESNKQGLNRSGFSYEALRPLRYFIHTPFESKQVFEQNWLLGFESLEQRGNVSPIDYESITKLTTTLSNHFECLRVIELPINLGYESNLLIVVSANIPIESLPHLITPLLRRFDVSSESRVINVPRETRLCSVRPPIGQ